MKIYSVIKICTDKCTYHYEVNLRYFLSQDKALDFLMKTVKNKEFYEKEDDFNIKEIEVEE